MSGRVYGLKYNTVNETRDIPAAIRRDIKAAVAAGDLPRAKYSVRSRRSYGRAIDITVSAIPFPVLNTLRILQDEFPRNWIVANTHTEPLYNQQGLDLLHKLEAMMAAYNHDGCQLESDYFDVRFYGSVGFDWSELQRVKAAMVAAAKEVA